MKIYLDNCSFNRPFDEQRQLKVRLETESKLNIQGNILKGKFELVWSYILDYENYQNPYQDRRNTIQRWKELACVDCEANSDIIEIALRIEDRGIKPKDALHIACAIYTESDYFITTDKKLLNKRIDEIKIINPIDFIRELEVD